MPKSLAKSVFLNIPYDREFEDLYLAYTTGLLMLGLNVRLTLAVPNDIGRLDTIIGLVRSCDYSLHDLSRASSTDGVPRFNMPLELGLALYRSRTTRNKHQVYIFEQERYRIQRSTSDMNGLDPFIHNGTPKQVMAKLRNIFLRESHSSSVPQMMRAFEFVREALPKIRVDAGSESLYEAAVFDEIVVTISLFKNQM